MARSALYVGRVRHRRFRPKPHRLSYRVWHVLLDLDELDDLDRCVGGFGHDRRALVEFRDADHFSGGSRHADPDDDRPVRRRLADLLAARGVDLPGGRVQVLTFPRVLGHVFNPVSFWWCHDEDDVLRVVVVEVNNTFGDQWSYVLDDLEPHGRGGVRATAQKVLHVSPFLPVEDHEYQFVLHPPSPDGRRVATHLEVHDEDGKVLDATLVEQRRSFDTMTLWRTFLSHPLVTLHTVVGIHWHALRIWLGRKASFHRRPAPPTQVGASPGDDVGQSVGGVAANSGHHLSAHHSTGNHVVQHDHDADAHPAPRPANRKPTVRPHRDRSPDRRPA